MVRYEFKNDEPDIIHERGYVYNLNYHIVWCTKYRNQALANPIIVDSLKDKILKICHENEYTVKALEIMPNHVHILVSAKPKVNCQAAERHYGQMAVSEIPGDNERALLGRSYLVTKLLCGQHWRNN